MSSNSFQKKSNKVTIILISYNIHIFYILLLWVLTIFWKILARNLGSTDRILYCLCYLGEVGGASHCSGEV